MRITFTAAGALMPFLLTTAFPTSSSMTTRQEDAPGRITVVSESPDSPAIDGLKMQARSRSFWLGGEPTTYCPEEVVGDACPPGEETVIAGLSSMATMVPGGQQMYVETSGAVGFTQAHSAAVPPGALLGGFTYEDGLYGFNGWDATGFMACPETEDRENYQVFANIGNATVPTGNIKDCLDFEAVASEYTEDSSAAWQYV